MCFLMFLDKTLSSKSNQPTLTKVITNDNTNHIW